MNGCPSESQWEAFVDGDLAPERSREFAAHLDNCPRCRALVDAMVALSAELGALSEPPLPEGFETAVMQAVRREPIPSPAAARRTTIVASLFAIGVIAEAAAIVLMGYGVTLADIATVLALRFPGLFAALAAAADWSRAISDALASPRGWVIVARVVGQTPWLWSAFVTIGLGVILLVRRLQIVKGVEPK
ncbi:MAG: anti-sigma factor family protein [Chloroflexota bacterium]